MTVKPVDLRGLLEPALATLDLTQAAVAWEPLATLAGLWLHYGRSMNLSGAQDAAGIAAHVAEGLLVVALGRSLGVVEGDSWLDVGSGAGFPGLVVASQLPVTITMVEPRDRRAGFLELALGALGRRGRVLRGRLEGSEWRPDPRERGVLEPGFRFAGARALFPPAQWLEVGARWVRPDGYVLLHVRPGVSDLLGVKTSGRLDSDQWSVRAVRGADVPRGT